MLGAIQHRLLDEFQGFVATAEPQYLEFVSFGGVIGRKKPLNILYVVVRQSVNPLGRTRVFRLYGNEPVITVFSSLFRLLGLDHS